MLVNSKLRDVYGIPPATDMHKVTSDGWRPDLSQFDTPETRVVGGLIKKCWGQDPNDGPDFKSNLKFVSDLRK